MKLILEPWRIPDGEFKPDNFHYGHSKPYRLWFEYLRLSPTYWLAHKHCTKYKGGLTDDEKKNLPQDFDEVIKTYEHFGNVYQPLFRIWWINTGTRLFGAPKKPIAVTSLIKILQHTQKTEQECQSALNHYVHSQSDYYGRHGFMVLAIPLTGKRSDLIKEVSQLILEEDLKPIQHINHGVNDKETSTYKLYGLRFRYEAAKVGLRLLWTRSQYRDLEPWQIGSLANISKIHRFPDINAPPKNESERKNRIVLGSLTNRKLRASIWMMENAARGRFSCQDEIDIPEIDYQYLWQNIQRRIEANQKRITDIRQQIEDGHLWDLFLYYGDSFDYKEIRTKIPE